jgi:hypothetical protein
LKYALRTAAGAATEGGVGGIANEAPSANAPTIPAIAAHGAQAGAVVSLLAITTRGAMARETDSYRAWPTVG